MIMPTLKKTTSKKTNTNNRNQTDMRKLRQTAYNNSNWRKLRDTYLRQNPLCEDCLLEGKVTPATDVHHKESPFKGATINYHKLLDYDNLQALCKECHGNHHAKEQGHVSAEDVIKFLDELLGGEDEDI